MSLSLRKKYIMSQVQSQPSGRLPSGYQEVEWIGCTGTQVIDTNVVAKTSTEVETYMYIPSFSDDYFLSARKDSGNTRFYLINLNNYDGTHPNIYTTKDQWGSGSSVDKEVGQNVWRLIKTGCTTTKCYIEIDGDYKEQVYSSSVDYGINLYLFGGNINGSTYYSPNGTKIQYLKMWQDGTLIRDLVPCYRTLDNEIGLYDLVNDVFYTNSGSGSFTKGNDVIYTPTQAVSFATDSWDTINAEAERISNFYQTYGMIPFNTPYKVYNPENNDTDNIKTITLSTNEQIQIAIIGLCHDDLTTPLSGGGTKAGITWQMVDGVATGNQINTSNTNAGSWGSSVMRTSTMTTYLGQLPNAMQSVLKNVEKLTSAGSQSSTINTTTDKLFLLSHIEVFGTNMQTTTNQWTFAGEGTQYEYYAKAPLIKDTNNNTWIGLNGSSTGTCIGLQGKTFINSKGQSRSVPTANLYYNYRNSKGKGYKGATAESWWLRSPIYNNNTEFSLSGYMGFADDNGASVSVYGIAYAGCI